MVARLIRVLPLPALLTAGLVAPAAAVVINGTGGHDVLVGTAKADTIRGFGGATRSTTTTLGWSLCAAARS